MGKTAEQWQEMIDNPDPRVKWAMDIFDQEGEDFDSMTTRDFTPVAFSVVPIGCNALRNGMNRVPIRTNMFGALLTLPLFLFAGQQFANWNYKRAAEDNAMIKHYILTHPELFPEPKKIKLINRIDEFIPYRW